MTYRLLTVVTAVWLTLGAGPIFADQGTEQTSQEKVGKITPPPFPPLRCSAHPSEEYQDYHPCPTGTEPLVEWCSGDCTDDDAKVRICCRWGD